MKRSRREVFQTHKPGETVALDVTAPACELLAFFLGVLLVIAGLCYLISTFMNLVFPMVALPFDIQLLSYVAETALCLWLIVIGVNAERWKELAGAA